MRGVEGFNCYEEFRIQLSAVVHIFIGNFYQLVVDFCYHKEHDACAK